MSITRLSTFTFLVALDGYQSVLSFDGGKGRFTERKYGEASLTSVRSSALGCISYFSLNRSPICSLRRDSIILSMF